MLKAQSLLSWWRSWSSLNVFDCFESQSPSPYLCVKLHEIKKRIEKPQNIEFRRMLSLCSVIFKLDRLHSMFDVGRSMFDVH